MSAQYDAIGTSFDNLGKLLGAQLVHLFLQYTVEPLIDHSSFKALDLACGTGRGTRALPEWGAEFVLGVDISTSMIEAARASTDDQNIAYQVGDCSEPNIRYSSGPFDFVLGCWLLNYAPSGAKMADMFSQVAGNLNEGGKFVSITPPATEDPAGYIEKLAMIRPKMMGYFYTENAGPLAEGVRTHCWAGTEPKAAEFDAYHLRKSVYEKAARAGEFRDLEWRATGIPEPLRERGGYPEV